jgi:hypothetical protein
VTHEAAVPRDLAERLHAALRRRDRDVGVEELADILSVLFYASLRTEEGQSIRCQVVYLDPSDPDPNPPPRIVADRWRVWPLGELLELNVQNVVKMAMATDPRTSSLAVHSTGGRIEIWGLVDGGNLYYDFLNFESESGMEPPGLFVASIESLGHLKAAVGFAPVGELRTDIIVKETLDVLSTGPVLASLESGIVAYVARTREAVGDEAFEVRGHWSGSLAEDWLATMSRLLLRSRRYGHGGAVAIAPHDVGHHVNVKYPIAYDRIRTALDTRARATIEWANASDDIHEFLENDSDDLPMILHLDERVSDHEREDSRKELDGAIWFASLLTRVDGLVLMNSDLDVTGFGVEITAAEEPANVLLARDDRGQDTVPLAYTRWGTRHRSMMRLCWQVPGMVGFVLSQDGDIRVVTRVEGAILVWENPLLERRIDEGIALNAPEAADAG